MMSSYDTSICVDFVRSLADHCLTGSLLVTETVVASKIRRRGGMQRGEARRDAPQAGTASTA
jgi:hypothetical protein